jgi:hypothetical protein
MTRTQIARLRAERTKRTLAALAVAAFLTVMLLARESHAGSVSAGSGSTASSSSSTASDGFAQPQSQDDFFAPSTSAPQVQTHVS